MLLSGTLVLAGMFEKRHVFRRVESMRSWCHDSSTPLRLELQVTLANDDTEGFEAASALVLLLQAGQYGVSLPRRWNPSRCMPSSSRSYANGSSVESPDPGGGELPRPPRP